MGGNGTIVAGHEYVQDLDDPLISPGIGPSDTLPRVRVRPVGGAVRRSFNEDTGHRLDESLQDIYDPDSIGRTFYHPVEELAPTLTHVPVSSKREGWYDPPRPHRIQIVKGWRDGKPILKEHYIKTGKELKELSESTAYRKSRFFESTGTWEKPEDGKYKRFVESFNPNHVDSKPADEHALDPRTITMLREADERFLKMATDVGKTGEVNLPSGRTAKRESAVDPFTFGDYGDTGSGAMSVTRNIDQEFVPIMGGPYYRQQYLYNHWEQ